MKYFYKRNYGYDSGYGTYEVVYVSHKEFGFMLKFLKRNNVKIKHRIRPRYYA